MSKAISINIETETENKEILTLCHINEKMLALETSHVAQKMLLKNRKLFEKLSAKTRITGGSIYRQEVVKAKSSTNSVYSPLHDSYEFKETHLGVLFFENNILTKQQRAVNKKGRIFDFDPSKVSEENSGGNFNDKKISPDDIRSSKIISTIEEIYLFQDLSVKSILISDTLADKVDLLEVGYKIDLAVETDYESYVKFVIDQAEKSIRFLNSYLQSLNDPANYDLEEDLFKPKFANKIMLGLGLNEFSEELNLGTLRVLESEFGKAAIACYNLSYLISEYTSKDVYASVMKGILPTRKTTIIHISTFISNFSKLLSRVKFYYLNNDKQTGKERKYSRISEGRVRSNIISATTKEKLTIEQEKLGYSLFGEPSVDDGLNKFSSAKYKTRWAQEQAKYYPNISPEDTSGFLRPKEKSSFGNLSNAPAFLTPTALIMGKNKINTSRGMRNMNIDHIRQFRLAKSARAQQQRMTKRPESTKQGRISRDILSSLNVTIAAPKTTLLDRATDEPIDPLVDSKHYVGEQSVFTTNNPFLLIKNFKRVLTSEERRSLAIAADIIPRRFLRNSRAINSIKEIQFSNPNSIVRKLASEGSLDLAKIPPQVKFMMSSAFNPNPNSDPMKNNESREIVEETIKNLFEVRVLAGFNTNSQNFMDVHSPIWKQMDNTIMPRVGRTIVAKAYDYEVPDLGIVKDNFLATIYNNLIFIRG